MRRTFQLGLGLLAMTGLLVATAAAQSLGEYARQQRVQKPAASASPKVYTNDNLPTSGAISEIGRPEPAPEPVSPRAAAAAAGAEQKKAEETKKLETEWRATFVEQKKKVAQLQRELDIFVGDYKLRQSTLYRSLATTEQLQYSRQSAEAEQKYQADLADKQKELDDAKQKLEDMKGELRKAGLPGSWAE